MKRFLSVIVVSLALLSFAQDRTDWPEKLVFGFIPVEGSTDTTTRFGPLISYLEQELGLEIEANVGADYAAVILGMAADNVDVAWYGPKSYVEASERAGAEAFVIEDTIDSGIGYNGVIITHVDSDIMTLEDARGRQFAFTDPNSTSGYLVPITHFLLELEEKPEDYFKQVIFSGTHEASILSVVNGNLEVAATNNVSINSAIDKGIANAEDFRILWQSPTIPGSPMAYRDDLPQSLKDAIKEAFLTFDDPEGLEALRLHAYVEVDDSTYDAIRDLNEARKLVQNQ